jgi:hypothetical protein
MYKRLLLYNVFAMMIMIILMFSSKNLPLVYASINNYNNNNSMNSIRFIIPLPFNLHIADQSINNENRYSNDLLPFP